MTVPVSVSGEDQPDPRVSAVAGAILHGAPEWVGNGQQLAAVTRRVLLAIDSADRAAGIRRVTRADECRSHAAALMGVVPELDDPEAAELVTRRAMQWEAEAERPAAAPVPVQEDRP